MDPHPVNRPTSAEALLHPWFLNMNKKNINNNNTSTAVSTAIIRSPEKNNENKIENNNNNNRTDDGTNKKRKSVEQRTPSGVMMEVDIGGSTSLPAQPDEQTVMQLKRLMNLNNQVRQHLRKHII